MFLALDSLMYHSTQETEGFTRDEIIETMKKMVAKRGPLVESALKHVLGRELTFKDSWRVVLRRDEFNSKGFRWVERLYIVEDTGEIPLGRLIIFPDSEYFEYTPEFQKIAKANKGKIGCVGCGPKPIKLNRALKTNATSN